MERRNAGSIDVKMENESVFLEMQKRKKLVSMPHSPAAASNDREARQQAPPPASNQQAHVRIQADDSSSTYAAAVPATDNAFTIKGSGERKTEFQSRSAFIEEAFVKKVDTGIRRKENRSDYQQQRTDFWPSNFGSTLRTVSDKYRTTTENIPPNILDRRFSVPEYLDSYKSYPPVLEEVSSIPFIYPPKSIHGDRDIFYTSSLPNLDVAAVNILPGKAADEDNKSDQLAGVTSTRIERRTSVIEELLSSVYECKESTRVTQSPREPVLSSFANCIEPNVSYTNRRKGSMGAVIGKPSEYALHDSQNDRKSNNASSLSNSNTNEEDGFILKDAAEGPVDDKSSEKKKLNSGSSSTSPTASAFIDPNSHLAKSSLSYCMSPPPPVSSSTLAGAKNKKKIKKEKKKARKAHENIVEAASSNEDASVLAPSACRSICHELEEVDEEDGVETEDEDEFFEARSDPKERLQARRETPDGKKTTQPSYTIPLKGGDSICSGRPVMNSGANGDGDLVTANSILGDDVREVNEADVSEKNKSSSFSCSTTYEQSSENSGLVSPPGFALTPSRTHLSLGRSLETVNSEQWRVVGSPTHAVQSMPSSVVNGYKTAVSSSPTTACSWMLSAGGSKSSPVSRCSSPLTISTTQEDVVMNRSSNKATKTSLVGTADPLNSWRSVSQSHEKLLNSVRPDGHVLAPNWTWRNQSEHQDDFVSEKSPTSSVNGLMGVRNRAVSDFDLSYEDQWSTRNSQLSSVGMIQNNFSGLELSISPPPLYYYSPPKRRDSLSSELAEDSVADSNPEVLSNSSLGLVWKGRGVEGELANSNSSADMDDHHRMRLVSRRSFDRLRVGASAATPSSGAGRPNSKPTIPAAASPATSAAHLNEMRYRSYSSPDRNLIGHQVPAFGGDLGHEERELAEMFSKDATTALEDDFYTSMEAYSLHHASNTESSFVDAGGYYTPGGGMTPTMSYKGMGSNNSANNGIMNTSGNSCIARPRFQSSSGAVNYPNVANSNYVLTPAPSHTSSPVSNANAGSHVNAAMYQNRLVSLSTLSSSAMHSGPTGFSGTGSGNSAGSMFMPHRSLSTTAIPVMMMNVNNMSGLSPLSTSSMMPALKSISVSSSAPTAAAASTPMNLASMSKYKGPLYIVEFKSGRCEVFYVPNRTAASLASQSNLNASSDEKSHKAEKDVVGVSSNEDSQKGSSSSTLTWKELFGSEGIYQTDNNIQRDFDDIEWIEKNCEMQWLRGWKERSKLLQQSGAFSIQAPGSTTDTSIIIGLSDWVIVEADRGEDLGRVVGIVSMEWLQSQICLLTACRRESNGGAATSNGFTDIAEDHEWDAQLSTLSSGVLDPLWRATVQIALSTGSVFLRPQTNALASTNVHPDTSASQAASCTFLYVFQHPAYLSSKELMPKRLHRLASSQDLRTLLTKSHEESLAILRCMTRVKARRLPMAICDAEYQWDRNKLTFYFQAPERIDFRELVRELFRMYKTRIWMCAVDRRPQLSLPLWRPVVKYDPSKDPVQALTTPLNPNAKSFDPLSSSLHFQHQHPSQSYTSFSHPHHSLTLSSSHTPVTTSPAS